MSLGNEVLVFTKRGGKVEGVVLAQESDKGANEEERRRVSLGVGWLEERRSSLLRSVCVFEAYLFD